MNFDNLLIAATSAIENTYFQLPISGSPDPIYRERVYCYELYHQLRTLWPNKSEYKLCGEIDKIKHPIIQRDDKPDFLVHVPGDMGYNEIIMEVKPINARNDRIEKDLETLSNYIHYAQYRRALYLVFGDGNINRFLVSLSKFSSEKNVDISFIELWHHRNIGRPAEKILP